MLFTRYSFKRGQLGLRVLRGIAPHIPMSLAGLITLEAQKRATKDYINPTEDFDTCSCSYLLLFY